MVKYPSIDVREIFIREGMYLMKRIMLTAALALTIPSVNATETAPVVDEYKELAALQMTAPKVFNSIVTVNSLTAYECNKVESKETLFNSKEFAELYSYMLMKGQDGSKEYVSNLKATISAVCNDTLTVNVKTKPDGLENL